MTKGDNAGTEDFLLLLPKTELHVHMEACARPSTLKLLCSKYKEDETLPAYIEQAKAVGYKSMADFFDTWKRVNNLIKTTEELEMITAEYLEDAAFMNCIYVELNLNILRQLSKGLEPGKVIAAIKRAQKAAESKYGIVSRTILSISRDWDEETALTVVEMASKYRKDNVVGIDVSGDEREKPNKFYKHVFRQAHKSGVKATAHAGENAGVQSVVSAVSETGVSRIGHGIDAASNARIIKLLKNSDIAVEICATSNFMLGHVRSLEAHPCKNLLRAGVSCTFNTDDPLLFGNNIYDEYRNVAQSWQLTTEQIVQASRNGIRYSFLDSGCKRELMQEFDKKAGKCQREFNLITSLQPAFKTAAL